MRLGAHSFPYRPARLTKLEKMLALIQQNGDRLVTVADLAQSSLWAADPLPEISYAESSWTHQYLNLFYRSCVGATFRPKFAAFLGINAGVAFLLLTLFAYPWCGIVGGFILKWTGAPRPGLFR
jgi:hypothetical protein